PRDRGGGGAPVAGEAEPPGHPGARARGLPQKRNDGGGARHAAPGVSRGVPRRKEVASGPVCMISAVFDCMVFLQAATNDQGPAFACLALAEANEVRLHVCPAILAEVQDVLSRPKIRVRFPHLTAELVDLFLLILTTVAIVV